MIPGFKGLSLGMKILSGAAPIVILIAAWGWGAWQYRAGENSRDAEVEALGGEIRTLAGDLKTVTGERNDLLRQAEAREKERRPRR